MRTKKKNRTREEETKGDTEKQEEGANSQECVDQALLWISRSFRNPTQPQAFAYYFPLFHLLKFLCSDPQSFSL